MRKYWFLIILFLSCFFKTDIVFCKIDSLIFSIEKDSTKTFVPDTSYHHSWKRAAYLSLFIPGSGQIYNEIGYRKVQNKRNRAWWKAPIIWGTLGVGGYYFYDYFTQSKNFKTEWLYRQDNPGMFQNQDYLDWTDDELLNGKTNGLITTPGFDIASKRRDLIGFGIIVFWGLNAVEALVDGHFVFFDVSEDLGFSIQPILYNTNSTGIQFTYNF